MTASGMEFHLLPDHPTAGRPGKGLEEH